MWEKKIILHCQFSIINCFGLVLVSVKRRNEVKRPERRCLSRRRVCGAHSVTQWRSSSADAALNFWFFSFKRKERIRSWLFGSFGSSQKNRLDLSTFRILLRHITLELGVLGGADQHRTGVEDDAGLLDHRNFELLGSSGPLTAGYHAETAELA